MRSYLKHPKRAQGGTTLIEVLVSIVVLSIGLLGSAGLMVNSMRNLNEVGNSVSASSYARELAERMMANRQIALNPTATNTYIFDTTSGTWPSAGTNCNTNFCTDAQRATWDVYNWGQRVRSAGSIPGVKVKTCYDSLSAQSTTWACTASANSALVVKIAWASRDATGAVDNVSAVPAKANAVFVVTSGAAK